MGANGPINVKRPDNEVNWPSSESKKKRLVSPIKQSHKANHSSPSKQAYGYSHLSPHRAARQLKLTDEELTAEGTLEAVEEVLLARVGGKPH